MGKLNPDFMLKEDVGGENLMKKNYNALYRDLDFIKLATAYEGLLKIRHGDFKSTEIMQTALSTLRNTIVEYLKSVRNLNVTDMDVQNFFQSMLSKFSSVMEENKKNIEDE